MHCVAQRKGKIKTFFIGTTNKQCFTLRRDGAVVQPEIPLQRRGGCVADGVVENPVGNCHADLP